MDLIPRSHYPDGWMAVHRTYDPAEAHIIAGRLQHEGIPSWIYQDTLGKTIGLRIGPLGEVFVLVRPDVYEEAKAILEHVYELDESALLDESDDDIIDGTAD